MAAGVNRETGMSEKKSKGRPKGSKIAATDFKTHGLYGKQMRACILRADGYTQFEAYCASYKVSDQDKVENRKGVEDKTYRLFKKPRVREYLRGLLGKKTLEDIQSRGEWLLSLLDDIQSAREAKNWPAVMNGKRMAGQAVTALRDSVTVVTDSAERDREIIAAIAGEDPKKRKALELLMGSGAVFEPLHVVSDNTKPEKAGGKGSGKGG